MAFNPTKEQQLAIQKSGNILVAAAAGSGKTAVLVERVIGKLSNNENPIDANRLLIVTFTNAAAAEMRSRIEKRLYEECCKQPDNIRLKMQRHLITSAKICTIDSFCIDLIRENFDRLNISPDFKVGDKNSVTPLSDKVLGDMIEERLKSGDSVFKDLLDITDSEYDEKNFVKVIEKVFEYSRLMPFPDDFLCQLGNLYTREFNSEHPWFEYVLKRTVNITEDILNQIATGIDFSIETEYSEKYVPVLEDIAIQISDIKEYALNNDWNNAFEKIKLYKNLRMPSIKGSDDIPQLLAVKKIVSDTSKSISELKDLFGDDFETISQQNKRLEKPILYLLDFIREYAERLFELQKQENTFTFYNTEQLALSMLCEMRDGEICMREDADEFLNRFDEVLVDEYQDTNDLQDTLFKILSDREKHLFIVGDVKQSIYGFRGANPNNFINKKNIASSVEECDEGPRKIILSRNFRSREGVCEYINFFFKLLMQSQTGKIVYDNEEGLVAGAEFPIYNAPCVDLLIIDRIKDEDAEENNNLILEARRIAEYIKSIMNSGECIRKDKNTLRKAKYSDFAILLRSTKNKSSVIANELRRLSIPVNFSQESYFERTEIATFLSLLKIIDNPDNDIALLTVMMSPLFNFTADEMALIRADLKKGSLITAVTAKGQDFKIQNFVKKLNEYRRYSVTLPLTKLISKLLNVTGYLNIVSAGTDGSVRRANLQHLITYAENYNQFASGGLGGFLRYLDNLPEDAVSAAKTVAGEDMVQIMSMHYSKGLQFPICILANTSSSMHKSGESTNVVYSENFGLGFKYYEEDIKKKRSCIAHRVIKSTEKQQRFEEELRLLYVAMTRAEEKLVILSSATDFNQKLKSISAQLLSTHCKITNRIFSSVSSMSDWVYMTALLHPKANILRESIGLSLSTVNANSDLNIHITNASELTLTSGEDTKPEIANEVNTEIRDKIKENLSYKYPFDALRSVEAKTSVSKLANKAENARFAFSSLPSFMHIEGISATGKGTATHKVMQFIEFGEDVNIDAELERLCEWQYITEEEAAAVDKQALKKFFDSRLYKRLLNADDYKREMRFMTETAAGDINADLPDVLKEESVIIQGAVDLCFVENGKLIIVDFKTDRVENEEELISSYSDQHNIYAVACQKIYDLPVAQKIIYSFKLGTEITL